MPKENDRAGERQGCEIGGAPLIPCDESSIVLEPGKEPLDFPAARVSTQGAPILGEMDPIGAMEENQPRPGGLAVTCTRQRGYRGQCRHAGENSWRPTSTTRERADDLCDILWVSNCQFSRRSKD
jgi:hypothetical protein